MNALNDFREDNGLTYDVLSEMAKNDRTSVFRHCKSKRIPAEAAVHYEATLGIPRWKLRPDLWSAPAPAASTALTPSQPQDAA